MALNSLGSKCSVKGILGKVIGYPEESLGGLVLFCTPHGSVMKTGIIHLNPLSSEEKTLLEKFEALSLETRQCLYDEEVIY